MLLRKHHSRRFSLSEVKLYTDGQEIGVMQVRAIG